MSAARPRATAGSLESMVQCVDNQIGQVLA
jgi:hypothetical protein